MLGFIDEIAVHYRLEDFVYLTSGLLHNRTVTGATETTTPAQSKLLFDSVTGLILYEDFVTFLRKMELLEGVTKDELRRLDGLTRDPNFKARPAVKKVILKALLSLHKDKRSRVDKAKQNALIAVALGTLLIRLKPNDDSKVNNTQPAEEGTKVDFILHSIYENLVSSVLDSRAEPAAKAQVTAAVAFKSSTILVEIMEQHRLSEEAERVLSMVALTV